MSKEKFHLFWGGIFSQWKLARIYDPSLNMTFNCNEQYMMYKKAELFGDHDAMVGVMNTPVPKQQKAIGRKVKNFNATKWEAVCREIVTYANYLKFSQNRSLLIALLKFDIDICFVEASPFDKIWGIGLEESDPDALDRDKWEGKNWLGEAINDARDKIYDDHFSWCGKVGE